MLASLTKRLWTAALAIAAAAFVGMYLWSLFILCAGEIGALTAVP